MLEKIIKIIADRLSLDVDDITLNSDITDDLGADSLNIVELVCDFEEQFDIKVSDRAVMEIKTVNDILLFLEKYSENERISDMTEGNQLSW
jgi:acyl carrier protein